MTDAGASPATAPVAAPSPAASAHGQPPTPGAAGPRQMQSPMVLDDDKKRELIANMDQGRVNALRKRAQELSQAGHTKENSTELARALAILQMHHRAVQIEEMKKKHQANEANAGNAAAGPSAPGQHVSLTPAQIAQVRTQAQSYHLLSRNQPVPAYLQQAAQGQSPSPAASSGEGKVADKTVEAVVDASAPDQPYAMELDQSSIIYPYNAYQHPSIYANRKFDEEITNPTNKLQRLLVPSVAPQGLDPYILMEERNRFVETRMAWRMKELEELDSTTGLGEPGAAEVPGVTDEKPGSKLGIQARIELLSLRLLGKQRLLREDLVRAMHGATQIPADRSQFRRFRTHTLRDARATENAERKQRTEREQRGKQRHLAYINSIIEHGQQIIQTGASNPRGSRADNNRRLGRWVLRTHNEIEKDEQRRIERLAKERLKALKNDDEDAYLALLGEAKDSRIGHLLKQTDQYLETLAAAVVEQQNDPQFKEQLASMGPFDPSMEEGASEAMFGARRQDGEEDDAERKAGKVDYYAVAHRIKEPVTKQASILTGGTLKDYQIKGLQWMISLYNNRLNGILADEMGLGKTIQTISLITYLIEQKHQPGPFLVIVPLSTLTNWTLEFERWAPAVKTLILKGSPTVRRELYPRIRAGDFQVCLTTYEYIIKERPLLAKIKWVHMIIDEGHRLKNIKSKLSQTLNEYYSTRHRLILTGTPLQNNLPELWALLNFVLPKIFNSVKSFDEWFNAPFANTGGQEKMEMNEEEALLVVKRLHKVLRPFLLRRLKKDVESELPDKVEKVIYTKMSALQWKLYESVKKYKTLPTDLSSGKPRRQANLQNAIMQLRKICNHPFVFREVDEDFSVGNTVDEQIVRTSGKFELLDRLLPKLFATGHKVLIFFQMTEIMSIIADYFDYRGWKYCRLDGSTKAEERQQLLSTFNDPDSPYQVFILSTRAGGLGLNLQSADTVIIYDTDWNPHADLQAQDRAHRIGQKKEVRVLRLISSGTVEELVLQRAQAKLEIDGKVIQAGKFDEVTNTADYEALLAKAFEQAADEEEEETNELDDDELNELLARGEEELSIFQRMDKERKEAQEREWQDAGNKGPLPPPLMQEMELPPFYRRDIGQEMAEQMQHDEDQGRGRRAKADVRYTDGLTDDQFINALEDSDDDVDAAANRKRQRAERKAERKRQNEILARAEAEGKPLSASITALQAEAGIETPVKKKRGRPSKSATPAAEDTPAKRRKVGGASSEETAMVKKLFEEVNGLKDEASGEHWNIYFKSPVDRKIYPDYYSIISQPIAMSQIKRKFGQAAYGLSQLRADLKLLWNNARTYNTEGSWVYNAAEEMESYFDRRFAEEAPRFADVKTENGNGELTTESNTPAQSGQSTPMYKPPPGVGTKIKLNVGAASRRKEIIDSDEESAPEPERGASANGGDDDDDDY
ncbi:chromatin structure remodeling complex protein STH1 [Trichosporon asahii var. asahii CBS 8904]|uniref:Chromatin structure remodeling complex protein STH1 n=1 Tax=Trichosporon asahii var. asahii (strain CBS 8904) TaxID=1220162 RepID=K1WCD2_TRIAC|nr:chromatin structure remodeling complex protein STH1 [Trichosporon asahii var. asahii CBS 8904]